MTYVLDGVLGSTKLLGFYLPPGEHKVTLLIEFRRVKNGTQLDVLVNFEKNYGAYGGMNFPEIILVVSLQSKMHLLLECYVR